MLLQLQHLHRAPLTPPPTKRPNYPSSATLIHAPAPPERPNYSPSSSTTDAGLVFREKLLYLEHHLKISSAAAIAANPSIRSASLSSLRAVPDFLSAAGLSSAAAARLLSHHPQLLTSDPHDSISPLINFLLSPAAALPFAAIPTTLRRCPALLTAPVDSRLRPTLHFLRRLGLAPPLTPLTALLLVSDVERTLIPKLHYLQYELNFSYPEVRKMILRSPGLLTCSVENNFKPKAEYLAGEMKRNVGEIKHFPQYFAFSLEGRIKPRHWALVENGFEMRLSEMLKPSDGEFRERLLEMRLATLDFAAF